MSPRRFQLLWIPVGLMTMAAVSSRATLTTMLLSRELRSLRMHYISLYRRKGLGWITKEPKAKPFIHKTKPASAPVEKARPQNNQNQRKGSPNNKKLKLADTSSARSELDKMGLHGKPRRNMIKWHKTKMKARWRTTLSWRVRRTLAWSGEFLHVVSTNVK